jgi:hypothetical protein
MLPSKLYICAVCCMSLCNLCIIPLFGLKYGDLAVRIEIPHLVTNFRRKGLMLRLASVVLYDNLYSAV